MNSSNKIQKIEEILKKNKINQENLRKYYSNKINLQNQIFCIDKSLLYKIENILAKICSLNLKEIEIIFNNLPQEEIGTQTDEYVDKFQSNDSFQIDSKFECEKTDLEKKYILSLNKIEANKHLLHEIKTKYSQTAEYLKKILIENKQLKLETDKLQLEYKNLNDEYNNLKDYVEKLEENTRLEIEFLNLNKNSKSNSVNLSQIKIPEKNLENKFLFLTESDLTSNSIYIQDITKYLGGVDIINLKDANSATYSLIEMNGPINKQILKSLIIEKNRKIEEILKDEEESGEYHTSNICPNRNFELESLVKKYINSSLNANDSNCIEKNRKEFATAIHKSIEFVLNDIKRMMKNSSNNLNNLNNANTSNNEHLSNLTCVNKNIFGTVGSMFKNVVNQLKIQTEDSSRPIHNFNHSTTVMKEDDNFYAEISTIEQYFLNFKRNEHNFYFNSPLELKNLIYSTFFRLSNPQSTQLLNIYIEEISLKFSHLLFFSIDAIKELIELRIVINHLNECLNNVTKEKKQIIKENSDLNRNINSLKYINTILINERDEIHKEIRKLNEEVNISNKAALRGKENQELITIKYNKIANEYLEMKYYHRKELNNLESDLATIKNERDEAVNILIKLKAFLNIYKEIV